MMKNIKLNRDYQLESERDYQLESELIREMINKGTVILGFFCIEDIELIEKKNKGKKYVKILVKHATNKRDNAFCIFDFNSHTILSEKEEFKYQIGDYVFIACYENHNKFGNFKSIHYISLIDLRYELNVIEDTQ